MNWNKTYERLSQKKWYKSLKALDSFIAGHFLGVLFIFLLLCVMSFLLCPKENKHAPFENKIECTTENKAAVIFDEAFYMEKIKEYARKCRFNADCINKKINEHIPKNYYVHIRKIKGGWEFACIDTTIPGNEEALKRAKLAASGH